MATRAAIPRQQHNMGAPLSAFPTSGSGPGAPECSALDLDWEASMMCIYKLCCTYTFCTLVHVRTVRNCCLLGLCRRYVAHSLLFSSAMFLS